MSVKTDLENALKKGLVVEVKSTSVAQGKAIKELMYHYKIETKIKNNDKMGFTTLFWIEKNRKQKELGFR
jgi:hypothetical protein